MNKLIKGLVALSTLILSYGAMFFSAQAQAQNGAIEVIACIDLKGICNNVSAQADFANSRARVIAKQALAGGRSAPVSIIMQSDVLDSAIRFNYRVYEDVVWMKGPNGQDLSYTTIQTDFQSSEALQGEMKLAVDNAVSPKAFTLRVAKQLNLPIDEETGAVDANTFCGLSPDLNITNARMINEKCEFALDSTDFFYSAHDNYTVQQSSSNTLGGSAKVGAKFFKIVETEANLNGSNTDASSATLSRTRNGVIRMVFKTTTGDRYIVKSQAVGAILEVVRFVAPPGQNIAVTKDGLIKLEKLEERLGRKFEFDSSSEQFLKAARRAAGRRHAALAAKLDMLLSMLAANGGATVRDLPDQIPN